MTGAGNDWSVVRLPESMAAKVTVMNGCWLWTGSLNNKGYGQVGVGGRVKLAHRVAYELLIGPIPEGLQLDHVRARGCEHKNCVNPSHLEPVTCQVNNSRTAAATKTHCVNGHPLSGTNLIVKRRTSGGEMRNCRICNLDSARRLREKKGAVRRYKTDARARALAGADS
ncbi:hypothetical protein CH274_13530 [Rhodococcus sp. 06-418-5]|uniref:HNH endonuclease n=1 Tax=Rhodococcus sp. 06-418-5 TaxID=2022507 RepID=UPI000B9ADD61|nr:HNH endonuclease [Rhodococcus sp. 06-418-5]OZC80251.1 hypothetical protein CH274_13530 [Rhodococcus sp. 06-418-5]